MMNKVAAITGFLGAVRNRYMEYQPARTLEEKLRLASKIPGLGGLVKSRRILDMPTRRVAG